MKPTLGKADSEKIDPAAVRLVSKASETSAFSVESLASITGNVESDCVRKFAKTYAEKHNIAYAVIMALNLVV